MDRIRKAKIEGRIRKEADIFDRHFAVLFERVKEMVAKFDETAAAIRSVEETMIRRAREKGPPPAYYYCREACVLDKKTRGEE